MLNLNSVCCAQGFPGNLGLDRGNCEVGVPSAEAEGLLDHYGIAVPFEAGPSWQRSRCPVSVWVSEVVKWGWSSGSGACRASRVEGSQLAGAQRVGDDLGHSDPHVPVLQQPVLLSWPPGGVTAPRDLADPARAPPNPHRDGRLTGCAGCLLAALPQPRPKRCRPTGPEP